MKKYIEILRKCPLFSGIEDGMLIAMLGCLDARVIKYPKKTTVFEEGSAARDIGIVLSGSAQIIRYDYNGNKSIIEEDGHSELICEAFACAAVEHLPVIAVASEDSEIMLVDCSHILRTCHKGCGHHQRMIYNLMKDLAEKNIVYDKKIEVTSKRTTREKLLAFLDACAREKGKRSFDIPFDRQELADYLEVDRSGLSTEIGKLVSEGIIKTKKRYFEFVSMAR